MKSLRLALMTLLMLTTPFSGFAAAVSAPCAMHGAAAAIAMTEAMSQMDHAHHPGMDMTAPAPAAADADADAGAKAVQQSPGCHCGCLCAEACVAGGIATITPTLGDGLLPAATGEAPALPQTPATRASIARGLLRPPSTMA